jgi:general secretion pathway protein A
MYEAFYNLKEPPFGATPDPRYLYKSQGHREALAYLAYGLFGRKGILALTGEVGIGKTTVVRAFVQTFHPCLEVAFVLNTNVDFEEMLYLIIQDFGIDVEDTSKVKMLSALNAFLIERYARHQNPVLFIDEAQNLAAEVLEELRLLSNLETDVQKLIQIVLVGQPELAGVLTRHDLRQLRQRIPGVLAMKNLLPAEVDGYIRFRLQTAGMLNGHLSFTAEANEAIYRFSGGIPRLINTLCDRVLMRGYMERSTTINRQMVEASVQDLGGGVAGGRRDAGGTP